MTAATDIEGSEGGGIVKQPIFKQPIFKYHGLGNDFVVMDRRGSGVDLTPELSRALCDRHRGIGADGVLVLLPSDRAFARMVVHNADGSIAEMCGNGLRCAVKYLADHAPERHTQMDVETGAGVLQCALEWSDSGVAEVEISMGPARLLAPNLPSGPSGAPFVDGELADHPGVRGTAVSMGNPHLVLFDRPLEEARTLGPALERAKGFPDRTNVEFVRFDADGGLTVVVWERGCGLTDACGTGACASVAAAVHAGRLAPDVWHRVTLPGGPLQIRVRADLSEVRMRGPVAFVFDAVVTLPDAR